MVERACLLLTLEEQERATTAVAIEENSEVRQVWYKITELTEQVAFSHRIGRATTYSGLHLSPSACRAAGRYSRVLGG